jgi:hypothetical protein
MPTLTNSSTLTFGPSSPVVDEVTVTILTLPVTSAPTGRGRLVHPTLGTLDYNYAPTNWTNIDGDVLTPPVWAVSQTLQGAATTLWRGNLRDVTCIEHWDQDAGELRMPIEMLRTLIAFYSNPPDPANGYVAWYPTYTTDLAYKVAMTSLTVGGQGITLDSIATRRNWARRDVELALKILDRLV